MIRRWFVVAVLSALLSGTILSLPAFWSRPVVGEKTSQVARHWLNCVFTASSALTGTGLSPHDIGDDFTPAGQALILGLMQIGGLGVLIAGAVIGWRFRQRFGWGAGHENNARAGLARLIVFVCLLTLLLEAGGAAAIYYAADRRADGPARPIFAAVFHSVSAFCNAGLTLTRDSLVSQGAKWPPYAIFLPLMVLGSIGGPVLFELWRKLVSSQTRSSPLSRDSRVTLIGTGALILLGTAAIFFIESTPRWQLRNPREDTQRLEVANETTPEAIEFIGGGPSRAQHERMRTMTTGRRMAAALFHSVSSRTAGLRVARLDEQSLSPADRAAMMSLMLAGGGLGGTAGGMRIVIVAILLGTLFRNRRAAESLDRGQEKGNIKDGQDTCPPGKGQDVRAAALYAAAAVATAMLLLVGLTTLALLYRETATFEACAFEAVSACCNVGFTAGLTRSLSVEGQIVIILAMLLGRVIPLAVLANELRPLAARTGAPAAEFIQKSA